MKSKTKNKILILLIVVVLALGATSGYFVQLLDQSNEQVAALQQEMEQNKQVVYVASKDIAKGETLSIEGDAANLIQQQIYTGLENDRYISANEIGMLAIVDIAEGTPVMKSMASALTIHHDTREYEIGAVNLMVTQKVYDMVDIRLVYPNGEDYIVLSKKPVNDLILENSIFNTYLNEEEILRYESAVVDAFCITGARLYTTNYVESNIQEEAVANYIPRAEVIDLIQADPNIVEVASEALNYAARENLEMRLQGITEEQLDAVNAGFGLTDTAKTSVITQLESGSYGFYEENEEGESDNAEESETTDEAAETPEETPEEDNTGEDE